VVYTSYTPAVINGEQQPNCLIDRAMTLDRKSLRSHERKILDGLVDFYYEAGYKADAYRDPETGGIYEHKLATRVGYELEGNFPPPEFLEAALILESQGFVRRVIRKPDFPVMGIWPTPSGLDHHEYLHKSALGKIGHHVAKNWPSILVSFVTTIVVLVLKELIDGASG
jgi:hypothetical protein